MSSYKEKRQVNNKELQYAINAKPSSTMKIFACGIAMQAITNTACMAISPRVFLGLVTAIATEFFNVCFRLFWNLAKRGNVYRKEKASTIRSRVIRNMQIFPGTVFCSPQKIALNTNINLNFPIVTSKQMTAEEALELYKSRDVSEKLFRGDKSYLGNRSLRVQSDEAASAKIFVEFVALIVRSRMYVLLKDEVEKLDKKPNYMTVPAAIRELEKIELVRQTDGKYCMDHAVTATQKIILKAFDMDADQIQDKAVGLSRLLEKYAEEGK